MEFESRLAAYAEVVDVRLSELLPPADAPPTELHEAMRYSCLAPGKRLRPALCLACAEAVGGRIEDALDAACAVEMVHCFSLIHDDLPALDDDELRRGLPTCHVKFGEAIAILTGDALLALAFHIVASLAGETDPARKLNAVRYLSHAAQRLAAGEAADILSEGRAVEDETLRFIHADKTGALLWAACRIGACLGGGDSSAVRSFGKYGLQLGHAFQIADDILNETASASQLGKAAGSDRDRQKATAVSVYGIEKARELAARAAEQAVESLPVKSEMLEAFAHFAVERSR